MGFFRGFLAPFRGAVFVVHHRLWRYMVVPFVLNVALAVVATALAEPYFREELSQKLGGAPLTGWWSLALVLLTILGGATLFIALQPLLSAIFCDRLSEVVERRVRGTAPTAPFLASTGRAILHGLLKLFLYGIALLIGLVLTIFTGIGGIVGVAAGALFLAFDGFDYPLSRRGVGFAGKWAYLAKRPAMTIGYALGTTLLYFVPLALFVAPPFAAAGSTLAFLAAEDRARARMDARAARAKDATGGAKDASKDPDTNQENPHNPIDISAS